MNNGQPVGERIGEFTEGGWGSETTYGATAFERFSGIVASVLEGHGRTAKVVSYDDGKGKTISEYFAEPPITDREEAKAIGREIEDLWEEDMMATLGESCPDQAGTFKPGQISNLQGAIRRIRESSPECVLGNGAQTTGNLAIKELLFGSDFAAQL